MMSLSQFYPTNPSATTNKRTATTSIATPSANHTTSSTDANSIVAYVLEPPPWRPPLHPPQPSANINPDVFPTRVDQPEDDLSQGSVRNGFSLKSSIRNETITANDMIFHRIQSSQLQLQLSAWMQEVLQRRQELNASKIAPWQYKPPSRVTLNDVKLANYVKDLADPAVPLIRLAKSVPHGFRGEKLFEMLWSGGFSSASTATQAIAVSMGAVTASSNSTLSPRVAIPSTTNGSNLTPPNSVEISRAVWFVRALGAAELSSSRNKLTSNFSADVTVSLCTWLAKQMTQLSVTHTAGGPDSFTTLASVSPTTPSTAYFQPRIPAGSNLQRGATNTSFGRTRSSSALPPLATNKNRSANSSGNANPSVAICNMLQDEVEEDRWISKWSYSLSLTRHLHSQHLLDRPTLLRWIIDAFSNSNMAQLPFLLDLVQEIVSIVVLRHFLSKPLIVALCSKIDFLDAKFDPRATASLRRRLTHLLHFVIQANPDALVSPRLWYEHSSTISAVVHEIVASEPNPSPSFSTSSSNISSSSENLSLARLEKSIRIRNQRLLSLHLKPASVKQSTPASVSHRQDMMALDSWHPNQLDTAYFQQDDDNPSRGSAGINPKATSNSTVTAAIPSAAIEQDKSHSWAQRIETMLTWACTDRRCNVARQYLAASLIDSIKHGRTRSDNVDADAQTQPDWMSLAKKSRKRRRINVEPVLLKWLNDVEAAFNAAALGRSLDAKSEVLATVQVKSVIILFGELSRRATFVYSRYLQRLIARGITTSTTVAQPNATTESLPPITSPATAAQPMKPPADSLHLRLLRSLPLYDQTPAILQQRKNAIYGLRQKETWEEAVERRALRELHGCLGWVFSQGKRPEDASTQPNLTPTVSCPSTTDSTFAQNDLINRLPHLWSASRFVRINLVRFHIMPNVIARLDLLTRERWCQLAFILVHGQDFDHLFQLLAKVLSCPLSDELSRPTYNLVIEHHLVWQGLGCLDTLAHLIRQQLNHASSVRNDKQAVLASNALLRLRVIQTPATDLSQEPVTVSCESHIDTECRSQSSSFEELDLEAIQKCQVLLHLLVKRDGNARQDATQMLALFRSALSARFSSSIQDGCSSSVDEVIERSIVKSAIQTVNLDLLQLGCRLIDQLNQEASTEVDERHARWLGYLSLKLRTDDQPAVDTVGPASHLLIHLLTQGTISLPSVVDHFLLPTTFFIVRRLVDPSTRSCSLVPVLSRLASMVSFVMDPPTFAAPSQPLSFEAHQSIGAQRALLLSPRHISSLVKTIALFTIATMDTSSGPCELAEEDRSALSLVTDLVLQSALFRTAFHRDPRLFFRAVRSTAKSVWGCSPRTVLDRIIGALDPSTLLLLEPTSIDYETIQSRCDAGWSTSVVINELVDLFERLAAVEPSYQSRADSRIRTLASNLYDDLFGARPRLGGVQLLSDAAGVGLVAKFADVGLGRLLGATDAAFASELDALRLVFSTMGSTYTLPAIDSESVSVLVVSLVNELESGETRRLDLLHLLLRLPLWSNAVKPVALRLVSALLCLVYRTALVAEHLATMTLLLDTTTFVLDELAASPTLVSDIDVQLNSMCNLPLPTSERIARLSYSLPPDADGANLMLAPCTTAAVCKGWFISANLKPFETLEYLCEPPQLSTGQTVSSAQPASRTGYLSSLGNPASMSLTLFDSKLSRDQIPTLLSSSTSLPLAFSSSSSSPSSSMPPCHLESEHNYGNQVAGEPIFARDLRRGLVPVSSTTITSSTAANTTTTTSSCTNASATPTPSSCSETVSTIKKKRRLSVEVIDLTDE